MQITFETSLPPIMNIEFLENRTLWANINTIESNDPNLETTNSLYEESSRGGSGSNSYSYNPNDGNDWGALGGMIAGSIEGSIFTYYMVTSTKASILPEREALSVVGAITGVTLAELLKLGLSMLAVKVENQEITSNFFQKSLDHAWSSDITPLQAITFVISASLCKHYYR